MARLVGNLHVAEAAAGGAVSRAHEQVQEAARRDAPPHRLPARARLALLCALCCGLALLQAAERRVAVGRQLRRQRLAVGCGCCGARAFLRSSGVAPFGHATLERGEMTDTCVCCYAAHPHLQRRS